MPEKDPLGWAVWAGPGVGIHSGKFVVKRLGDKKEEAEGQERMGDGPSQAGSLCPTLPVKVTRPRTGLGKLPAPALQGGAACLPSFQFRQRPEPSSCLGERLFPAVEAAPWARQAALSLSPAVGLSQPHSVSRATSEGL